MRGKPWLGWDSPTMLRIIPAHAGQTQGRKTRQKALADHPRACGANPSSAMTRSTENGSSPRMRGKPLPRGVRAMRWRIIPAHAGQTCSRMRSVMRGTDHPRACGANILHRTRGEFECFRVRIIPAHAGQTSDVTLAHEFGADHPRACGANTAACSYVPPYRGSSPRMRGKRLGRLRI